jgi:glutamate-5-semialdehyde dehydrogenase
VDLREHACQARQAARQLALSTAAQRAAGLEAIARALAARREEILAANQQDLKTAGEMVAQGELAQPLVKRLDLGGSKFAAAVEMVQSVQRQADPLGRTLAATELAEGLRLFRVSVPIGVIGVIFESRPDALVQIASLCLKAGNAVLLKGGREAARTNQILYEVIARATKEAGLPLGWIWLLETREEVRELLALDEYLDLIIPRGSNEFVRYIMEHTRIPVTGHADGICHVYVDRAADLDKALRISVDAKTQYVAVCNAAETLLVHRGIAPAFLARAVPAFKEKKVELRGDAAAAALVPGAFVPATEEDWRAEYLDYILAVRVVDSLEAAVEHINRYSSHHTDTIVTEDGAAAAHFLRAVDSASVIHNASTRFADGFRYGLGAEVGISTGRLHSRGPVGLEGLIIYKYILEGDGHTVDDFEGATKRAYSHRPLALSWRPEE